MGLAKGKKDTIGKSAGEYEVEFDTKDSTGTVKSIERRAKYALKKQSAWREVAKEDFKFALGDQWTTEERQKLKDEGRPCLTFNKIEPLIDLLGGWERENSMRIRIFPEGGEDKVFSEIGDKCLDQIDKQAHLNYKLDHQFDDGIICGKGWLEMAISYDRDVVHGDLIFRNDTIYQVLSDPDGKEYDLSDSDYIIKLSKLSKEKLKKLFPEKEKIIEALQYDTVGYLIDSDVLKEGDKDNYHLGKEKVDFLDDNLPGDEELVNKFLLKEYWHRKYAVRFFVFDVNNNRLEKFEKKEEAEARRSEILAEYDEKYNQALQEHQQFQQVSMATQMSAGETAPLPEAPVKEDVDIQIIKRPVMEMWYAASAAGYLLQEDIHSPFSPHFEGFPIFPFFAKQYISAHDDTYSIKGITRNVKDSNREINKSRSQFLHILNTSANSGWIGDKDALTAEGWKDLENIGSIPGIVIKKKVGSQLERIQPTGISMGNITRGEKAESDIKEISGINPDAMALSDKDTSGKAISLRIRQVLTILAKYFRNFRYTKELIGQAIYAIIPELYDIAMLKKILGEEYIQKNQIDDGYLAAFLAQIEDGRYNVTITEADNTATIRQETFDQLLDLAKTGAPIPPDVIIEFSSIPNSREIIDRIKVYAQEQMAQMAGQAAQKALPAPAPNA